MKYLGIVLATVLLTLLARAYVPAVVWPKAPIRTPPMEVAPHWLRIASDCDEMNAEERQREELVVQVLRDFRRHATMLVAAKRHLGNDQYRWIDEKTTRRLCLDRRSDDEIAKITLADRTFAGSYLNGDELRLARRLGPRDPKIVEAVAATAFRKFAIINDYGVRHDIRSLARVVLAEFGDVATPWSEQAFEAINTNDALGTTAAQLALAAGHPQALARITALLDDILKDNPKDPIPRLARNRFYELAHALALLGPRAQPHAGAVVQIMSRKVQSWAPPFGMLELSPRRMCRVLQLIGGSEAETILLKEVCRPKVDTWEQ
ncbi:MAG: hypothetical protein FJX62_05545 [Alphaproteobacteria bacterium]|nr:hypothetical protein [Alphaproteobacteria bacterium]